MLSFIPERSLLRVEVLALLGLSHGMVQHYEESYKCFSEALTLDPLNADLWYNHGLASRYTTRLGQAMRDFQRAVALSREDTIELTRKFISELEKSRKDVEEAMQEQKESITLGQFIEREELFMQAVSLVRQSEWKVGKDQLSNQEMIEHLHDFKEVLKFEPTSLQVDALGADFVGRFTTFFTHLTKRSTPVIASQFYQIFTSLQEPV